MNKNSTEYIEQVIAKEVANFEQEATALLKNTVKRHRFSGELERSVDIVVKHASKDFGFELKTYFADQGRMVESKQSFVAGAPIQVLEDWIKKIGLSRFAFAPEANSIDKRVSKLAWALKKGSQQGLGTISGRQMGQANPARTGRGTLKRGVRSEKISWFYKPYLGLWGKYRQRIFNAYFASLDDQFVKIAEAELNKVKV